MDLWIRSQNREDLSKAKHLGVYDKNIYINGYEEHGYCIGEYETKERALEVLDEIHNFIENYETVSAELEGGDVITVIPHKKVYEMPKE